MPALGVLQVQPAPTSHQNMQPAGGQAFGKHRPQMQLSTITSEAQFPCTSAEEIDASYSTLQVNYLFPNLGGLLSSSGFTETVSLQKEPDMQIFMGNLLL